MVGGKLIFHLYDLDNGEFEEEMWPDESDVEPLIQSCKDRGYRLVLEGFGINSSFVEPHYPRFVPAGRLVRWMAAREAGGKPPSTHIFIWEKGSAEPDDDSTWLPTYD